MPKNRAKHVLVVEDDRPIRDSIVTILEDAGHVAETAASGQQALQLLAAMRPDLLILDYGLPDMTGADLLSRLGERPAGSFPVLLLTARIEADSLGAQLAVDATVGKPFDLEAFEAVISRLLGLESCDLRR